jgi:hypothetical protein
VSEFLASFVETLCSFFRNKQDTEVIKLEFHPSISRKKFKENIEELFYFFDKDFSGSLDPDEYQTFK